MGHEPSISVIVPVYNEEKLLAESFGTIHSFMGRSLTEFEILLIESGSTDGSARICDELARSHDCVRVIHQQRREGFGSALKCGYRAATKDLVWLITIDIPFPLETIHHALPLLEGHGAVISRRSLDDRGIFRRLQSRVYNGIVKAALGLRVTHVNSAFRVYKRSVLADLPLLSDGWFLDAEVLYRLDRAAVSCAEIPVPLVLRSRGRSSVGILTFLSVAGEMLAFLRRR